MPTKRTRISRNLIPEISEEELHFLSDGLLGTEPGAHDWRIFSLHADEQALRELWTEHREVILTEWIRENPGTRPALWWEFDAPRATRETLGCYFWRDRYGSAYPAPRARLGGIGTPTYESYDDEPSLPLGLPDRFVSKVDIRFSGIPIDSATPPTFETQCGYLRRFGLLTPDEARRLKAKDFTPEVVELPEIEDDESISPQLEEANGSIQ